MIIAAITLFPDMFDAMHYGVIGRAQKNHLLTLHTINPRDFSDNGRVDDRPYGGGPGMVMQYEPLHKAVLQARQITTPTTKVIHLSPQGQQLTQQAISQFAKHSSLILVSSRYEGVDERFIDLDVDEQWSLGDYVLSGGELAAMVLIDAITRTLPGVLGDSESAIQDSFSHGLLDYPHYTRPEMIADQSVPSVLLSGHHIAIQRWRLQQSLNRTWQQRPNLVKSRVLTALEQQQLDNEQIADKQIPDFRPGDTVIVQVKVKEGNRERLQAFEGVVIAIRKRGINSAFTVRKVSHGEGVERVFQTYSPLIASIKIKRRGDVRRAKLYYLRKLSGRKARIKEKIG